MTSSLYAMFFKVTYNVPSFCDVAKFGTTYFQLQINLMRNVNINLLHYLQHHKTSVSSCFTFNLKIFVFLLGYTKISCIFV